MFKLSDMISASIEVDQPHQLTEVFKMLNDIGKNVLRIIKIQNNLNQSLQNVRLNFIFSNQIIGEIRLCCKTKQAKHCTNLFLYELC